MTQHVSWLSVNRPSGLNGVQSRFSTIQLSRLRLAQSPDCEASLVVQFDTMEELTTWSKSE